MKVRELRQFLETCPDAYEVCIASEDDGDCIFKAEKAFLFPSSHEVWITVKEDDAEIYDDEDAAGNVVVDAEYTEVQVQEQANMLRFGKEV